MPAVADTIPLVAHIIHALGVGGLENGLVNLLNHLPARRFRHAVVCLTDYDPVFRNRIQTPGVTVHALHKRPGQDWGLYVRLWRLLRRLRPAIVHTRNLAALEAQLPAALAGVKARIHSEHGWDTADLDGSRYLRLRRLFRPLVGRYIALSRQIEDYLLLQVKVPPERVWRICNGVDSVRFHPAGDSARTVLPAGFAPPRALIIGAVGRMEAVKDPLTLAQAFVRLLQQAPAARERLRLLLVGDGSLRPAVEALLRQAGVDQLAWLPGAREDVPALLRSMDIFALPSLAEGISNTILEAMASGLPVVATAAGGNAELVIAGETGWLTPPGDPAAMAMALGRYADDPALRRSHGAAARRRVEQRFSLAAMRDAYLAVYEAALAGGSPVSTPQPRF